jgi:hypothetical protein
MPQPTTGDLHVNKVLTQISVGYVRDDQWIADKVFPRVPVDSRGDIFMKYNRAEWNRTDARMRAPGTESVGSGWSYTQDNYRAEIYAFHKDITDPDRAAADDWARLDQDATRFVTRNLLLLREVHWRDKFFKTGVWGTDLTGVAAAPGGSQFVQWDQAASNPTQQLRQLADDMEEDTGYRPNTLVLGPRVKTVLMEHDDFIERIKYTQRGVVTEDLLAGLIGVDRVLTARAVRNTAEEGAVESENYLFGKQALLVYTTDAPSLMEPSGGYIFTWNGLLGTNSYDVRIKNFRMENIESDRIEGEMAYDMKVVASDVGVFLDQVVA